MGKKKAVAHYWTDTNVDIMSNQTHEHRPYHGGERGEGGGGVSTVDNASDMALYEALQSKVQECEMLRELLLAEGLTEGTINRECLA